MKGARGHARRLAARLVRDEAGSTEIEYLLLLAFVVLPIAGAVPTMMDMLLKHFYGTASVIGGPFP